MSAALFLLAAGAASAQGTYDTSAEVKEAMERLATEDPQVQRARWGDLAAAAGKVWLSAIPGQVASVWRRTQWTVPGSVMQFERGFCITIKCQRTQYVVQYNEQARQLEFFDAGAMAYVGSVQGDGSVRLTGTGLIGVLTAETLRFDAAAGLLYAEQHELRPATAAVLHEVTAGFAGEPAPAATAPTPPASEAELRAELAAMKVKMEALSRQVAQQQIEPAPRSAPTNQDPANLAPSAVARPGTHSPVTAPAVPARLSPAQAWQAEREAKELASQERKLAAQAQRAAQAEEAKRLADEARMRLEAKKQAAAEEKAEAARLQAAQAERAAEEARMAEEARARQSLADPQSAAAVAGDFTASVGVSTSLVDAAARTGTSAAAVRYGSLAVHRKRKGGHATAKDRSSAAEAEAFALRECNKVTQGGCETVITFHGAACASFRAVDPQLGDAWGLGFASGIAEASRLAMLEGNKHANGVPLEYSLAVVCNGPKAGSPGVVYALERDTAFRTVEINGKVWSAENMQLTRFRNGDVIPRAPSPEEFHKMGLAGKPAYMCYTQQTCKDHGKIYNGYAVMDPRGIAPAGWRVPTQADYEALIAHLGGSRAAGPKLRVRDGWKPWVHPANNASGFSILPSKQIFVGSKKFWENEYTYGFNFWTSTPNGKYHRQFHMGVYDSGDEVKIGNQSLWDGFALRLVKE